MAVLSGFSSFIGKVESDWHSRFVKVQGIWIGASGCSRYTCVRVHACVNAGALSVENVPKVSHFLPSFRFPDGRGGWNGRHETRRARRKTRERSSTEVKEPGPEESPQKKKRGKNNLVKISLLMLPTSAAARRSKYQNVEMRTECARKKISMARKGEKYSREEKSNPPQCISGQAEEGGCARLWRA